MSEHPRRATAKIDGETVGVVGGMPAVHRPVRTEADARSLANAMATTGNYPPGMDPCFTAGINGDQTIADHCIFDNLDFCDCERLYGFTPRERCADPDHTDEMHYPAELGQ